MMRDGEDKIVHFTSTDKSESRKQRRIVLTEEEYTNTLSSIITRDYYPSLPSLYRDAAILQKRSEGDIASAVQIRRAARNLATHEELKAQSDEMEEIIAKENGGIRKRARSLDRENLDGFHQRVTTEDNTEFEENMKREVKEKKQMMDIVYQSSGSDYRKVGQMLLGNSTEFAAKTNDSKRLQLCDTPLMASDEFNAPVERIQVAGTTIEGKNKTYRNALFFTPQHLTEGSDDRFVSSQPGHTPTQLLLEDSKMMPPPSRNAASSLVHMETSLSTIQSNRKDNNRMHMVEYKAKPLSIHGSNTKQIVPSNTRFQFQTESRIVVSASNRSIEPEPAPATLKKLVYDTDSSAVTDLDASPLSITLERKRRLQRIERDRNTFVTMTPLIIPGRDDGSPIMTWGDVASTPLVTRGDESNEYSVNSMPSQYSGNYELPIEDRREAVVKIAEDKLAKKAKRFKNAGKKVSDGKYMSNSSVSDRASSLTPAARALLARSTSNLSSRVSSNSSARSSSAFGSALRSSYTPRSEKATDNSARSGRRSNLNRATPLISTMYPCKNDMGRDIVFSNKAKESTEKERHDNNISTSGLLKM